MSFIQTQVLSEMFAFAESLKRQEIKLIPKADRNVEFCGLIKM